MQKLKPSKRLLSTTDLDGEALEEILTIARKGDFKIKNPLLFINIFFEASTRTSVSFQNAALKCGFSVINFDPLTSSILKDETIINTIRTLNSNLPNSVAIRCKNSGETALLSKYLSQAVSVINAGDGTNEHPTQALLDLYTILNEFNIKYSSNCLKDFTIAIVGDIMNSRVARSNIFLLSRLGAKIFLVSPPNFLPQHLALYYNENFNCEILLNLNDALKLNLNVIMLLRVQRERMEAAGKLAFPSTGYSLKSEFYLGKTKIMHPGPINPNVEISSESAYEFNNSLISKQVENGVLIRSAILKFFHG
jgi:aspartate carbamoyltransferase catalytic subunit